MNIGDKNYLFPEEEKDLPNPLLMGSTSPRLDRRVSSFSPKQSLQAKKIDRNTQGQSNTELSYITNRDYSQIDPPLSNINLQKLSTNYLPKSTINPLRKNNIARALAYSLIVTLIVVTILSIGSIYVLQKNNGSQIAGVSDVPTIISKVKELITLPNNEDPQVSLIDNADKVKTYNPEFFKDIQKGDYFLLYSTEAIVYRPANNKIIAATKISK